MTQIGDLAQHLLGQWRLLQAQERLMAERWRDEGYLRFRRRHWEKWDATVPSLFPVLERLDAVVNRGLGTTEDP